MISTLQGVCDYLPHLYMVMFMVSIGTTKQQTSLSIIVILLSVTEFAMNSVAGPLREALNDKSIEYVVRLSAWIMFWCVVNFLVVLILQKSHEWLNLAKGRVLTTVQVMYGVLVILQLEYFINAMFIKAPILNTIHYAGIPATTLIIGVYLLFELILSLKANYANRDDNSDDFNRSF